MAQRAPSYDVAAPAEEPAETGSRELGFAGKCRTAE
jgi:hypothetical protein